MQEFPESPKTETSHPIDPVVCFCLRLTESTLKRCYERCGSLEALKSETRAGTACRGCLSSLTAMFNERDTWHTIAASRSPCVVPGQSLMKGLVLSMDGLETKIIAANSPAPQISSCQLETVAKYVLVDRCGRPVLQGQQQLVTNQSFTLDTVDLNLPRPFVGQILYQLERKNRGSGRLTTRWYSAGGMAVTHENGDTGRPRVYCPIRLDEKFISGPNRLHLVLVNPHSQDVPFVATIFSHSKQVLGRGAGTVGAFGALWIDAEATFITPIKKNLLKSWPSGGAFVSVESNNLARHGCLTCYVFVRNLVTEGWSCQHL